MADRGRSRLCKKKAAAAEPSRGLSPGFLREWEARDTEQLWGQGSGGRGLGMKKLRPREQGCLSEVTWRVNG